MINNKYSPWPSFSKEEIQSVNEVLLSNKVNYWTGQETIKFEKEFGYKKNLFMKPSEDGSSIDIFRISNNNDFISAKMSCVNKSREFIFEEEIKG